MFFFFRWRTSHDAHVTYFAALVDAHSRSSFISIEWCLIIVSSRTGASRTQWQRRASSATAAHPGTAPVRPSATAPADPDREAGVQGAPDTGPPDGCARTGRVAGQDQHAGASRSEQAAEQRGNAEGEHRGSQPVSVVPRGVRQAALRHADRPVRQPSAIILHQHRYDQCA